MAERLQTHPSMLSRTYNRMKLEDLKKMDLSKSLDQASVEVGMNTIDQFKKAPEMYILIQAINEERTKAYKQLEKRIAREKQLLVAQQKMEIKKIIQVLIFLFHFSFSNLFDSSFLLRVQNKKESKPQRIAPGTKTTPPVYKWKAERKR